MGSNRIVNRFYTYMQILIAFLVGFNLKKRDYAIYTFRQNGTEYMSCIQLGNHNERVCVCTVVCLEKYSEHER